MNSIEKGDVIDVKSKDSLGFALGLDLTEGQQRPIAFVVVGPLEVISHRMDISQAREVMSALAKLIEHVQENKVN